MSRNVLRYSPRNNNARLAHLQRPPSENRRETVNGVYILIDFGSGEVNVRRNLTRARHRYVIINIMLDRLYIFVRRREHYAYSFRFWLRRVSNNGTQGPPSLYTLEKPWKYAFMLLFRKG